MLDTDDKQHLVAFLFMLYDYTDELALMLRLRDGGFNVFWDYDQHELDLAVERRASSCEIDGNGD